jgi:drug/metabolite transporter (DMT)-like permease
MYIAFFIYSLSGVFSKIASNYSMLSWQYVLCFGVIITILGIYAVLWQQVLKNVQLSVAMANKPIVLVLGTIWAVVFFGERIGIIFVIGMLMILGGLIVIGTQND